MLAALYRVSLPVLLSALFLGVPYMGFLLTQAVTHGLDPAHWPAGVVRPEAWLDLIWSLQLEAIASHFAAMAAGSHPAFVGGGFLEFLSLIAGTFYLTGLALALSPSTNQKEVKRDPDAQFGDARWATKAERKRQNRGLELGLDLETGRSVRVRVEGNLLTITPPRKGKTSGLIINNLLGLEEKGAWHGPAVVIDPKGDVYKAVGRRRQELGRPVYRLDLREAAVGSDTWNPLADLDVANVLYLQRMAYALLPDMRGEAAYFRQRGSMFLAAIIAAAILEAQVDERSPTPADVHRLLNDRDALTAIAEAHNTAIMRSLRTDLRLDDRSLSPLISTAQQAVQWLLDERMASLVATSTLDLKEVARGGADLFVIVPTENLEIVAPLLRWLITDLFQSVRTARRDDDDRVLLFIDEAKSLGNFPQLLTALGELPSRGISTWTFWQTRGQIEDEYGPAGARTFYGTAEVSTFSNLGGLAIEDLDHFSKVLGHGTEFVETEGTQTRHKDKSASTGRTPQQVRLMTPDQLTAMPASHLITIVTGSDDEPHHPMRLRKVRYFDDPRYAGLYDDAAPAKRAG